MEIVKIFPVHIREALANDTWKAGLEEIRVRVGSPLEFIYGGESRYLPEHKGVCILPSACGYESGYRMTPEDLREMLNYISDYSLYAYSEEVKEGYLTIEGGHRIGMAGQVVKKDGKVTGLSHITFLNVRIAHEIRGCADGILPYIYEADRCEIFHTLLISPPRCGKTTLLRDLIRQISNGNTFHPGMTVGVVDERSEIGACYHGIPQNDLGIRSDVLDDCPKHLGMMMLIRTMSPKVVAVDEIGSREDLEAMEYVMNCGCKLLATVHGNSLEEIRRKPVLGRMVEEAWFGRYVILERNGTPGHVAVVLDGQGRRL